MEEVLVGWNEYRVAVAAVGNAGRKLAGAIRELVGVMDKTEVPGTACWDWLVGRYAEANAAQTMRPIAVMLESISELMIKLAKKVDKEYDEANGHASKYFTLLAKESRTHEAYLGVMDKRHDKAVRGAAFTNSIPLIIRTGHRLDDHMGLAIGRLMKHRESILQSLQRTCGHLTCTRRPRTAKRDSRL
jgi:hypothetical protein